MGTMIVEANDSPTIFLPAPRKFLKSEGAELVHDLDFGQLLHVVSSARISRCILRSAS